MVDEVTLTPDVPGRPSSDAASQQMIEHWKGTHVIPPAPDDRDPRYLVVEDGVYLGRVVHVMIVKIPTQNYIRCDRHRRTSP